MAVDDHTTFFETLRQMDDKQLFAFFHSLYTMNVLELVAIATGSVALREYFAHMGAEYRTWKLLFQGRIMPARLAILVVRYAYIGAFLTAVYFMFGRPSPSVCDPLYRSIFGLYTVLWGASGSVRSLSLTIFKRIQTDVFFFPLPSQIFLMRLNIIFAQQKAIMALFISLWAGCVALWLFITAQLHAYPTPKASQFPYGPLCISDAFPKIGAVAWAGSIIFDSVVFVASFIRFRHVSKTKMAKTLQLRSRKWIFRSNLYYFGASFFFNTAMLFSSLFVNDPVLSNVGNSLAFSIHCCMATRLVFNTRGWAASNSVDDEDDFILNTFNKNKRNGANNTLGVTSRIEYTVDETVVTSAGDPLEEGRYQTPDTRNREESNPQSSYSHRDSFRESNENGLGYRDKKSNKNTILFARGKGQLQMQNDELSEFCTGQDSMPRISISRKSRHANRSQKHNQSTESLEEKTSTNDHPYTSQRGMEDDLVRPPNAYMGRSSNHSSLIGHSPSSASFDLRPQPTFTGSTSAISPTLNTRNGLPLYSALDQNNRQLGLSSPLTDPILPLTCEIQQAKTCSRRSKYDRHQE